MKRIILTEVQGYGWLPYDYLLRGLAADVWAILQSEWTPAGEFGADGGDPRMRRAGRRRVVIGLEAAGRGKGL